MPKGKTKGAADRLEAFCQEYVKDNNITRSATVAGFSPKTAGVQGSRLLKGAKASARIAQLQAEIAERNNISVDGVLKALGRVVYFDARKLVDAEGNPIPLQDLDDDTAGAIHSVEFEPIFQGKGAERKLVGHSIKYKASERNPALANAMRTLGLFKADNEQHTNPLKEMFDLLNATRGRKGPI